MFYALFVFLVGCRDFLCLFGASRDLVRLTLSVRCTPNQLGFDAGRLDHPIFGSMASAERFSVGGAPLSFPTNVPVLSAASDWNTLTTANTDSMRVLTTVPGSANNVYIGAVELDAPTNGGAGPLAPARIVTLGMPTDNFVSLTPFGAELVYNALLWVSDLNDAPTTQQSAFSLGNLLHSAPESTIGVKSLLDSIVFQDADSLLYAVFRGIAITGVSVGGGGQWEWRDDESGAWAAIAGVSPSAALQIAEVRNL
jgi:hypothetical protein